NGSIVIDNGWFVPYNPYLSKKFKAHINVKCCQSVDPIKFINKYVYGDSDRTTLKPSNNESEIERHLQGRYFGPTEASARILEYKIHEEDPTVALLALHLPNQQSVYFLEDATPSELEHAFANSRTMPIAYFYHYQNNPTAQKYLYQDFPQYFVWNKKDRVPQSGERFYLRLLLINVAGSKSFEDLQSVDGVQCETFMQVCLRLHLTEDNQKWSHCFNEAVMFSTGSSLRNLFVTALTFVQMIEPALLWEEFCVAICDDLAHKLQTLFPGQLHEKYTLTDDSLFYKGQSEWDYGLFLLDEKLGRLGSSLETCQMLSYKIDWANDLEILANTEDIIKQIDK
ncbi:hypothetical protein A0J61_07890, partial [Choanephora cucurbitarum]